VLSRGLLPERRAKCSIATRALSCCAPTRPVSPCRIASACDVCRRSLGRGRPLPSCTAIYDRCTMERLPLEKSVPLATNCDVLRAGHASVAADASVLHPVKEIQDKVCGLPTVVL